MFARIKHTIKKTLKYWQYRMLPYRIRWEKYVAKHPKLGAFIEEVTWQVVLMVLVTIVAFAFVALWGLIPRTGPLSIIGAIIGLLMSFILPLGFLLLVAWLVLGEIWEKILDFQAMLRRKRRARAEGGSEMKNGLNNIGKIRWLVLGALILVVAAVLLTVTSRMDEVWVGVLYDRPWQGEIGDIGSLTSWGAQGVFVKLLERPEGTAKWIISANAQKMDGSNDELKIFIFYENNNGKMVALARANTSQPYGIAQVTCQVKKL